MLTISRTQKAVVESYSLDFWDGAKTEKQK